MKYITAIDADYDWAQTKEADKEMLVETMLYEEFSGDGDEEDSD
ncbi:hypothetical protein [uncultured Mobiluncus sp.]|nr:hypothetical protein [uncultured Mobiluncus sp.]